MKLENQVCGLELSKKLDELKVTQNSLWYWVDKLDSDYDYKDWFVIDLVALVKMKENGVEPICYSAFTVAELGGMLPFDISSGKDNTEEMWEAKYYHENHCCIQIFKDKNEANAKAKMLIWLIENKHIKINN